jgi:multiple sugar transport system substrate-binding protein
MYQIQQKHRRKKMTTKLTRRQMLKLTGAAGATAFLAACGGETETVVETVVQKETVVEEKVVTATPGPTSPPPPPSAADIVMMYQANEISEDEIAQFNADYTPVSLTRIDVDKTRFYAMFAAGEAPDLLRTQAPDIPQMLARNVALNLQPYFDSSTVLNVDDMVAANDYYKASSPLSIGQGDLYGMAKDWAPDNFLWVNETVFEAAGVDAPDLSAGPMTAEQLGELARAVTTTEGDRTLITGFNGHTGFIDRWWMLMAQSAGGSMYSDDFQGVNIRGNDAVTEAIQFIYDLQADGAMNSPLNPSPEWFGPDFVAGRLSMVWTGYWFHGNLVADPNEEFQAAVADGKVKLHPNFTWKGTRSNPCITAAGAIVSAKTKAPDAAWAVFEWFMGKEPAQGRASSGWGLPALKSMFDLTPKEGPLSAQAWETVQAEMDHAGDVLEFNPFLAGGEPDVPGQIYNQNLEAALNDDISFDDLVDMIQDETEMAVMEGVDRILG